ncbi:EG45-like domain containing protein [Papaver somniferum]|uniref:EG45-like domain containing protein n=1 Tax=Papaver somniferum TaxID=3469 RepID=UPI000E6F7911|nr:EG45-like domain containing protein [Papaver somniferum]
MTSLHHSSILLLLVALISLFCPLTSSQSNGIATFNTPPYVPSSCDGFQDDGVMIAEASDTLWNGGGACGSFYQVTCISGTNAGTAQPCLSSSPVVVKIVDYCPPPQCRGTLDLSQEAFASIADPNEEYNRSVEQSLEKSGSTNKEVAAKEILELDL